MPLSSCHIREYMTSTCFITLITWLKWLLPDIPTIFPYPYSSLWNIGLILIDILENIFRNLCSTMRVYLFLKHIWNIYNYWPCYLLQSKSQIPMHQNHTDYNMWLQHKDTKPKLQGFPGGWVVRSLPANAGDMDSIPGLGRFHMSWNGWAHALHNYWAYALEPRNRNYWAHAS